METYVQQLLTLFKNMTLNAVGIERDFYKLISDKDVNKAIGMMQDRHDDVDEAIKEYNPQTHKVMERPNKRRKGDEPYITEKLPRTRQRYINEVELFFLLGASLQYKKESDSGDEAFALFNEFIRDYRMDSIHREFKRLCGSETEAAIVFHLESPKEGEIVCKPFIAARSTGYDIRPLFDQYGNLLAFAYGYVVKGVKGGIQHWDIMTPEYNFECTKGQLGTWEVVPRKNVVGKICAIYGRQPKAWEGAESRIHREEMMDSHVADTNNYFADPIAYATADVISLMGGKERAKVGRLLQYTGKDSQFGYINPPQSSESRRDEMVNLTSSILFDTFTPDFSYENIKGLGTLSGEAIENAMILGFIKRANRMEIYGELFDREASVIRAILGVLNPNKKKELDELKMSINFQSPFTKHKTQLWASIATLFKSGVCSLETAVSLLALTDAPEEEVAKIKQLSQEAAQLQAMAKTPPTQE